MKAILLAVVATAVNTLAQPAGTRSDRTSLEASKRPFRIRTESPIQARANRLITVVVGGAQDTFVPNLVNAAVGDVIQFQFSSGNHTVTQSTETAACQPLQASDPSAIHSGHIPYQDGQTTVGTFNMPVTSTDPMFLYCATGPHCQEGQVLVVNPTSEEQLVNYSKLSAAAAANVDGGVVSGGTVGQIALEAAAFTPPAAEEAQAAPADTAAPAV
ncbi:Extracellular serine-rich protein [Pleurostoma richardsiae]|uniref:Extracellular serine-rich protein n=1 Tax=Pleurostoma richardsiae TaxID=41990 RepID=A0AA38RFY2_9PEZI|nr:Extracellular serine-rich protein [Pleurostoma richardsiae]